MEKIISCKRGRPLSAGLIRIAVYDREIATKNLGVKNYKMIYFFLSSMIADKLKIKSGDRLLINIVKNMDKLEIFLSKNIIGWKVFEKKTCKNLNFGVSVSLNKFNLNDSIEKICSIKNIIDPSFYFFQDLVTKEDILKIIV